MNIVILGGSNDCEGNLNIFTKNRCIYAIHAKDDETY